MITFCEDVDEFRRRTKWSHPVDTELLIPYVEDFQVILKIKTAK